MTHCEALAGNRLGIDPGGCPGELVQTGEYADRTIEHGRVEERIVAVYRCEVCGTRVSMAGNVVLNCYRDPLELVRSLAESMAGAGRNGHA